MAVFSMILFGLEKFQGGSHTYMCTYLEGRCKCDRTRIFSVMPSERARDNGHKLEQKRL